MSTLLPTETIAEMPTFSTPVLPIMASPSAPLCVMMATPPSRMPPGPKVASIDAPAEYIPKMFGPSRRIPCSRAQSMIRRSSSMLPISEKPDVITRLNAPRLWPAAFTASYVYFAGTHVTMRSTSISTSSIDFATGSPRIRPPFGLTG